jgi:uncharacterized protein YdeI (YjbR/CyaY-like superfamily)
MFPGRDWRNMEPTHVTHFESGGAFRDWLERHHTERDELWVGFWKKSTRRPSITWPESVDEALCFGWIDGIRKRVDDEAYTIRFTPRRSGSTWSLRNIERYEALEAEGRIAPAGARAFGARTEENSGRYSFEQEEPVTLSGNYLARLQSNDAAWADWQSRPPGYRKQVAHWVMSARREETRGRRLETLIEDCAAGRKVKPLRL